MSENFEPSAPTRKRPVFLIVLLILTSLSLLTTFFTSVVPIVSGPMNEEQLQQEEVKIAKSKKDMAKLFSDEELQQTMFDSLDLGFSKIAYINNKAFWLYHLLQLLIFGLGGVGVYFMYHLNKKGFHFYIVYCLLSIGQVYLVFPSELIVSADIIGSFVISALFVGLYAINLKHFTNTPEDENKSYKYDN
jgi:hypothetical protein